MANHPKYRMISIGKSPAERLTVLKTIKGSRLWYCPLCEENRRRERAEREIEARGPYRYRHI